MKNYYRVMLGKKSVFAGDCFAGGFIGVFGIDEDLTDKLPDRWREFNKRFIPALLAAEPGRSKISAGLECGSIWTVCKGIHAGDTVLSPDGTGSYRIGEVTGDYYYVTGESLPHRRKVLWFDPPVPRSSMSEPLRNSTGSIGTVSTIKGHDAELESLLGQTQVVHLPLSADDVVEDPLAFAMEKHLEDFLVTNWEQTALGKEFLIYEEAGEKVGQQYPTDAGPIDILAISRDKKQLLVVELKRGRASDAVVGQVLRYMGFLKEQVAEPDQSVEGAIIALDDDQKIRWALLAVPSISFYRYQVSFKLVKS